MPDTSSSGVLLDAGLDFFLVVLLAHLLAFLSNGALAHVRIGTNLIVEPDRLLRTSWNSRDGHLSGNQ